MCWLDKIKSRKLAMALNVSVLVAGLILYVKLYLLLNRKKSMCQSLGLKLVAERRISG